MKKSATWDKDASEAFCKRRELERELKSALSVENYERAAEIRDELAAFIPLP